MRFDALELEAVTEASERREVSARAARGLRRERRGTPGPRRRPSSACGRGIACRRSCARPSVRRCVGCCCGELARTDSTRGPTWGCAWRSTSTRCTCSELRVRERTRVRLARVPAEGASLSRRASLPVSRCARRRPVGLRARLPSRGPTRGPTRRPTCVSRSTSRMPRRCLMRRRASMLPRLSTCPLRARHR